MATRYRYLPDVVKVIDKTQLLARVTTAHNRLGIDLSGCGGSLGDIYDHL